MLIKYLLAIVILITASSTVYAQSDTDTQTPQSQFRLNLATPNQLTVTELNRLGSHDIVLLIDKSGSMNTSDCPKINTKSSTGSKLLKILAAPSLLNGPASLFRSSRWNWCGDQAIKMADEAQSALPDGFTVVLFDGNSSIHTNMTTETLPGLFRSNGPGGGTFLAPPLDKVFNHYFNSRGMLGQSNKPLLIGIITDGIPLDPQPVLRTIVAATHAMRYPMEVTIVFFLIGEDDAEGNSFINDLFHQLPREGATYNIVRAVPFRDLEQNGLARSLAMNLQ